MTEETKNLVGRPTKYKPEYCKKAIEYFNIEPTTTKIMKDKDGNDVEVEVAVKLPTIDNFAIKVLEVAPSTVRKWANEHKEFSEALNACKAMTADILAQNGLTGRYHPVVTKFVGVNYTDMKDKQEMAQDVTTGGQPLQQTPTQERIQELAKKKDQ